VGADGKEAAAANAPSALNPALNWPYAGYKRRRGVVGPGTGIRTLDTYYATADCELCGASAPALLCDACASDPQRAGYILLQRKRAVEEQSEQLNALCRNCTGINDVHSSLGGTACDSLDCPVYFQRVRVHDEGVHYEAVVRELGLE
jgi:DNA polymerase zeta